MVETTTTVLSRRDRPWAERAVWGALWVLSTGEIPGWLDDHQRSRIQRRLESLRPSGLLWAARTRAEAHRFRASQNVLDSVQAHVTIGGARAIGAGSDLSRLDGYVTPDRFDWIRSDFPVVPDPTARDLTLRVSTLVALVDENSMPVAFAAADVTESDRVSEAEQGLLLVDDLLRGFNEERRGWLTCPELARAIADEIENGDEVFALRLIAKTLSDARSLTEPADVIRFLAEPATTGDQRWDVLLAAVAARECRLRGIHPPAWTDVEGLEPWWFPALIDDALIPLTVKRTPPELASRGIWLDERALTAS